MSPRRWHAGVDLAQDGLGARRSRSRPRSGRGAGCPRRRSPRGGTPGSTPARHRRRPGPARPAAPAAGPRCPPAPSTCRRPGTGGPGAGPARRPRRRRSAGRRRTRPCAAACRRRGSARRRGRRLGVRRGEPEPAALDVLAQQGLEVRLVERGAALGERGDLLLVHVHADDVEAELGHGGRVRRTEVAGAEDAEAQGHGGQATDHHGPLRPAARAPSGRRTLPG